jgi:hypothetical protein
MSDLSWFVPAKCQWGVLVLLHNKIEILNEPLSLANNPKGEPSK